MNKDDLLKKINYLNNAILDIKENISKEKRNNLLPYIKTLENEIILLSENLNEQNSSRDFLKLCRHPKRPTTLDYINYLFSDFIELHGDRRFSDDLAIVGGVGFFENIPVTVIGTQKGRDTKESIKRNFGYPNPEGYRKALRLMKQAEKFRRPIINFIDTPGAYPCLGAEERGQGEAIAANIYEMSTIRTPIISIVTGEGGSGGALALAVADKVLMLSNAYYSVISPEGCASILWKDSSRVEEAVNALKINSNFLLQEGIVDGVIDEPIGGAHTDHAIISNNIRQRLRLSLQELLEYDDRLLLEERFKKFRSFGKFQG